MDGFTWFDLLVSLAIAAILYMILSGWDDDDPHGYV